VAVDVEFEQHARMIAGSSGLLWGAARGAERAEVGLLGEDVDRAGRVVLADPVLRRSGDGTP
jgi:hypothetical protein